MKIGLLMHIYIYGQNVQAFNWKLGILWYPSYIMSWEIIESFMGGLRGKNISSSKKLYVKEFISVVAVFVEINK